MAVGPVVVSRCQDDWMPDGLERIVDGLILRIGAGPRFWASIVAPGIGLSIADMNNEGEVGSVERGEHPLIFLLLNFRVGHVADEAELESTILSLCRR